MADLHWVGATTARQRDMRKPVMTPEQAAREMQRRIADRVSAAGYLFGRERNGLESSEVADCDAIIMIPINNAFASLNLAQAVLLLGYAWLQQSGDASLGRVTHYERPLEPGVPLGGDANRRPNRNCSAFSSTWSASSNAWASFHPSGNRSVVVTRNRADDVRACRL